MSASIRKSILSAAVITLTISLWRCSPAPSGSTIAPQFAPATDDSGAAKPSPAQMIGQATPEAATTTTTQLPEIEPTDLPLDDTPPEAPIMASPTPTEINEPELDRFARALMTGQSVDIVGVYVEDVLKLRVVQQVEGDPAFVSSQPGVSTEFLLAFRVAGNIGLLAHNYLAGALFFDLQPGHIIYIIYGDGEIEEFEVARIERFQALDPYNPSSDFSHLENGSYLSASELFNAMYAGEYHLTMQTCIEKDGNNVWGRIFIISPPY